jgi:hypothetical protein
MYRVINVQEVESYPGNYDWLSDQEKSIIVNYLNGVQNLANRYYNQYLDELAKKANNNKDADVEKYLRLYNHTITSLTGSKNAYATLRIMCEYDWPGHDHKWFLATKEDAQNYNEFQETEVEDNIDDILDNFSLLLQYGEVGL